jgi:TonB-dependent SusC/RagA subfamily outer membrane receptor
MKDLMQKMLKFRWVVILMLLSGQVFAQKDITGTVTDATTGEPLPGVSIVISGTTMGTITDFDGNFSITVPEENNQLEFSMIGFSRRVVTLDGASTLNVTLQESTTALEEIVVTGYSTQSRAEMTTSISKLDTKNLESVPRSNAATALQGTIAGLKVTQTTGQPGSTPSMVVRGGTSFSGTGSPLILIDGVPGSFYALNADDIESMEVLKDAASTAIYGARAANGVILVTTKKGKAGTSNVSLRAKFTSNQRREDPMEYLGARDYVHFNRLAIKQAQDVMG